MYFIATQTNVKEAKKELSATLINTPLGNKRVEFMVSSKLKKKINLMILLVNF